ncbi:non-hydrolyzing UDP-N-acetylglucosamine 2-epimerase [Acidovorax sp. K2F]|uniref:non-hydrolyzing UDP-N-acetylglucosamine 2-epimerase n=1 Tax=Acidovorax sp. K2F TaxID=2978125 RepID=UPI0021B13C27|nr:UDP-N-acetylglucosamine 2-epimerase (non-hydrolyzing) [Acidovorax sp. K2F]MCT6718330.1 UDP-N-acetylglucosamine 2-epimerase (non-hydrolyzing) [Acidovorax sp. K2F]
MRKIVTVIGARPQFIKASAVSRALHSSGRLAEVLIHTGQHFDSNMSEVFFSELAMPTPKYNLGVHGGQHGAMTGQMLEGIERILIDENPDAVLVYGDTNSTLAGTLAAVKLHIPVAHVEAGLRSFNMRMPEEINRILTDRISTWLFTPTVAAVKHLRSEGVASDKIIAVGDVMYDVALHFSSQVAETGGALSRLGLSSGRYVLATVHRAENTGDAARLEVIVAALSDAARKLPMVWPLHPRTRGVLQRHDLLDKLAASGVRLIEPVGYLEMVQLEKYAALVVTDSGGVQKEAYFFQVPCVTMRDETEWVELVEAGWNRLAPPDDPETVTAAILDALGTRGREVSPYGSGDAADKIVARLTADLGN